MSYVQSPGVPTSHVVSDAQHLIKTRCTRPDSTHVSANLDMRLDVIATQASISVEHRKIEH